MTETSFYKPTRGFTVGEIAALTGAEPRSGCSLDHRIVNVAPLDSAGPNDLAFLDNVKYSSQLSATRAGACLMTARFEEQAPTRLNVLRSREPYRAFVTVTRELFPEALRPSSLFDAKAVASGASIHPSARLEIGVVVDPGAVIGPRAEIGAGTVIGPNAVIGPQVRIGRDCSIGAASSILNALIGDRVIVHPGCRLGQDGFGFVMGPAAHVKVPQIGRVIIQDDVEIGAGTTIDRGAIRDTVIGEGTKIDNLVQVGHNTAIGRHCIIVAQTGISGSVTLEDYVVLGARSGVRDHVRVGEGAQIAGTSVAMADVPAGAQWGGSPAKPIKQWKREIFALKRLAARGKSIKDLGQADDDDQRG
ncbi:MAG: UDP-3-O-[3-hydroxymyristoyl] glucosamine N-acyltransferase [Alphaproteobacteria bacterium]|jgi:UDP-3-O-[3-hydroxymyristoyl] glucosamine N-acyltransferase|nr:UDP-3-O-[3-hydroxymyristoyl] glucosamine N-acyltransferase [Alphaproteobacteria bacterium]